MTAEQLWIPQTRSSPAAIPKKELYIFNHRISALSIIISDRLVKYTNSISYFFNANKPQMRDYLIFGENYYLLLYLSIFA